MQSCGLTASLLKHPRSCPWSGHLHSCSRDTDNLEYMFQHLRVLTPLSVLLSLWGPMQSSCGGAVPGCPSTTVPCVQPSLPMWGPQTTAAGSERCGKETQGFRDSQTAHCSNGSPSHLLWESCPAGCQAPAQSRLCDVISWKIVWRVKRLEGLFRIV